MDLGSEHPLPDDGQPSAEQWVRTVVDDATAVRIFDIDGTYAAVHPLLFHWTLIYGAVGDNIGFDDRWCYPTRAAAEHALAHWNYPAENEPTGWHRNPRTGRRRDLHSGREWIEG